LQRILGHLEQVYRRTGAVDELFEVHREQQELAQAGNEEE
jgi:hypothetical protein